MIYKHDKIIYKQIKNFLSPPKILLSDFITSFRQNS